MNENLTGAILWKNSMGDIYGAMVYNETEYSRCKALHFFTDNENLDIDEEDTIEFGTANFAEETLDDAIDYIGEDILNKTEHYAIRVGTLISDFI